MGKLLFELVVLIAIFAGFYLLNSQFTPIISSMCIGSGLGLFKKIANAERRVSPRFVTSFIFYVSFALIIISPYLKYPILAHQIESNPSYYESRGIVVAFFFAMGLVITVAAFSICNAM